MLSRWNLCMMVVLVLGLGIIELIPAAPSHEVPLPTMKIVDTHVHLPSPPPWMSEDDQGGFFDEFADKLVKKMDATGVGVSIMGLNAAHLTDPVKFSKKHDDWVAREAIRYPNRIWPAVGGIDITNPQEAGRVESYLQELEQKYGSIFVGFAEMDCHCEPKEVSVPVDGPVMRAIAVACRHRHWPLLLHATNFGATAEAVEEEIDGLAHDPGPPLILAHTCAPQLAGTRENVWREYEFQGLLRGEKLDWEWGVLGTDTQTNDFVCRSPVGEMPYESIISGLRGAMADLPKEAQERLAFGNAERLYNKKI